MENYTSKYQAPNQALQYGRRHFRASVFLRSFAIIAQKAAL